VFCTESCYFETRYSTSVRGDCCTFNTELVTFITMLVALEDI
jgi:hypothetical protein